MSALNTVVDIAYIPMMSGLVHVCSLLTKLEHVSGVFLGGVSPCTEAHLYMLSRVDKHVNPAHMCCVQGQAQGDAGHQEEDQGRAAAC